MSLLDALERKQNFSEAESAVADYILGHLGDLPSLTMSRLAEESHASNSTIVRVCKRVGADGYRSLRIQLAREAERSRAVYAGVSPDLPFGEETGSKAIMDSIASLTKQAVDDTHAILNPADIRHVGAAIAHARRIVLEGIDDTMASLEVFSTSLLRSGISCTLGRYQGGAFYISGFMERGDVVLVASYGGRHLDQYEMALHTVAERGVTVVVLTANEDVRRVMPCAKLVLRLPQGETYPHNIATYYSQTCIRYALNCVYGEVLSRTWKESSMARQRQEETVS